MSTTSIVHAWSLDDFVALSEEIAALSRAGIPLSEGLADLSQDLPRPLAQSVQEIGRRLAQGETLDQVLADPKAQYPPAYVGVIGAGLRSGRLPAAIEGLVTLIRQQIDLRRNLGLGLLYPLIVVLVAFFLMCFTFTKVFPQLELGIQQAGHRAVYDVSEPNWIVWLRANQPWWQTAIPWILVIGSGWVWYRSGRVAGGALGVSQRSVSAWKWLIPWWSLSAWRRSCQLTSYALFSDLTALLLEHGTPLLDAVSLAAKSVADVKLREDFASLGGCLQRGETEAAEFPHIPAWLTGLLLRQTGGELPRHLREYAQLCRAEAADLQHGIVSLAPLVATLIWAGGATVLHAILVFGPYISLLFRLSGPVL